MDTKSVSVTTIVRNPVQKAKGLSRKMSQVEIRKIPEEKQKADRTLTAIEKLESELLPIEQGLLPAIKARKEGLAKRKKQLESLRMLKKYAIFSLEPLTWRNKQGYPLLAVFSTGSPKFELAYVGSSDGYGYRRWAQKVTPNLPKDMIACYQDVLDKLKEMGKRDKKTTRLSAQFEMLIPPSVKKKIASVKGELKEVFIIAETPRWDLKQTTVRRKDPLVVGWDGLNYWLITTFNATPLEKYLSEGSTIEVK
ncbi:hypothetical protein HY502_02675 [Candidatus Woesebacteria bacterium]|nr:hypothetical protein [Candidatus Woesebacteria bacterium]